MNHAMNINSNLTRIILVVFVIGLPLFYFRNTKIKMNKKPQMNRIISGVEFQRCIDVNDFACVENLLKAGISPDTNIGNIDSPLIQAIKQHKTELAMLLIDHGADVTTNSAQKNGVPPLFSAIETNNLSVVSLLVQKNADVNAIYWDKTPLRLAVEKGNSEIVKILLDAHANAGLVAPDGKSAVQVAKEKNNYDLLYLLDQTGQWTSPSSEFIKAVEARNYALFYELINQGVPVNQRDEQGRSALLISIENQENEMANILISKGADPNLADREGRTPIFIAVPHEDNVLLRKLIEAGADVNVKASIANVEHYEAPSSAAGDISLGIADTPLMYAVAWGTLDTVKLFLAYGAKINVKNSKGTTPLMFAVATGNKELAELMIQNRASLNDKNDNNQSALDLAKTLQANSALSDAYSEIEKYLIAQGAHR